MKKLNLLLTIIIGLSILSCSSSDDHPQLSMSELLTQNSPWTFNHYEMINIIDAGNSSFAQSDVENSINQSNSGNIVTFNEDGTGSSFLPNEGTDNWQWEIVNDNQLKLTYDSGDVEIFENISVSSSQLFIEIESVVFDEIAIYEVTHYGKYFYD